MKLSVPLCPQCGYPAKTVLENMLVDTSIWRPDDDNPDYWDYQDGMKLSWDSEPVLDEVGLCTVSCGDHQWQTLIEADDE